MLASLHLSIIVTICWKLSTFVHHWLYFLTFLTFNICLDLLTVFNTCCQAQPKPSPSWPSGIIITVSHPASHPAIQPEKYNYQAPACHKLRRVISSGVIPAQSWRFVNIFEHFKFVKHFLLIKICEDLLTFLIII